MKLTTLLLIWFALCTPLTRTLVPVSAPETASDRVTCPTCEGSRVAPRACPACLGGGAVPCSRCAPSVVEFSWRRLWWSELELAELERRIQTAQVKAQTREQPLRVAPGRIYCPVRCEEGLVRGQTCAVCQGKGGILCLNCAEAGELPCSLCEGSGAWETACADCNGAGSLARLLPPRGGQAWKCAWCRGRGDRPCKPCKKQGRVARECPMCRDTHAVPCLLCGGARRTFCTMIPCKPPTPGGGGTDGCEACSGTGISDCFTCQGQGGLVCVTCKQGKRDPQCSVCAGSKRSLCNGCHRSGWRPWSLEADFLIAEGRDDDAERVLVEARRRVREHFALLERFQRALVEESDERLLVSERIAAEREVVLAELTIEAKRAAAQAAK